MHRTTPITFLPGPAISPIVGNTQHGSACRDGKGQALYAVYDGTGAINVYRTTEGYAALLEHDASVTYLTQITAIVFKNVNPSTALQWVNGTLYCVVDGWKATGDVGTWIYRDNSLAVDGSGPWVLHATVQKVTVAGDGSSGMAFGAGEITVLPNGRWVMPGVVTGTYSDGAMRVGGVFYSDDAGASWSSPLTVGYYLSGAYGTRWSRNIGQWAGAMYVGGQGESDVGKHYKSTDGATWTSIGDLGADSYGAYAFPMSDPNVIYRWEKPRTTAEWFLDHAAGAPESLPAWSTPVSLSTNYGLPFLSNSPYPYIGNIGPPGRPLLAVSVAGKVMRLSRTLTKAPPCRLYPREDGLGMSSATRQYPQPRGQQTGFRQTDYY